MQGLSFTVLPIIPPNEPPNHLTGPGASRALLEQSLKFV